jgi:hypothetical protein
MMVLIAVFFKVSTYIERRHYKAFTLGLGTALWLVGINGVAYCVETIHSHEYNHKMFSHRHTRHVLASFSVGEDRIEKMFRNGGDGS